MSLINRMLKDVERRKPKSAAGPTATRLRHLPLTMAAQPGKNTRHRWLWLFGAVLLGGLVWLVY